MKICENQLNQSSLAEFGAEASRMLANAEFESLAEKFGYALAFGREPAAAIAEDLSRLLCGRSASGQPGTPQITVKHFKPNDSHLLAVVECLVPSAAGVLVFLELVAARNGDAINLFLEDLSAAA